MCLYSMLGHRRNSEGISFQCLSHLSQERTPYQNCGCMYLLFIYVVMQVVYNSFEGI